MQHVLCPGCATTLRLRDEFQGRRVKCPACETRLVAVVIDGALRLERFEVGTIESSPLVVRGEGQERLPAGPTGRDPLFEIESAPTPPPIHLGPQDVAANHRQPSGNSGQPEFAETPLKAGPRASGLGASGLGASGLGASGLGASGLGASGRGASGRGASRRGLPAYLVAAPVAEPPAPRQRKVVTRIEAAAPSTSPLPIATSPWAIATASSGLVLVLAGVAWILAGLSAKAMFVPPLLLVIGLVVICRALWLTEK